MTLDLQSSAILHGPRSLNAAWRRCIQPRARGKRKTKRTQAPPLIAPTENCRKLREAMHNSVHFGALLFAPVPFVFFPLHPSENGRLRLSVLSATNSSARKRCTICSFAKQMVLCVNALRCATYLAYMRSTTVFVRALMYLFALSAMFRQPAVLDHSFFFSNLMGILAFCFCVRWRDETFVSHACDDVSSITSPVLGRGQQ